MAERIKRGVTHPDGASRKEAQAVGPYPPWDAWKHNLFNEFPSLDHSLPEDIKSGLAQYYSIRRLEQLGVDQRPNLTAWMGDIEKKFPDFYDKYGSLIKFIKDNTQPSQAVIDRRLSVVKSVDKKEI